jgi:hypothetical protein
MIGSRQGQRNAWLASRMRLVTMTELQPLWSTFYLYVAFRAIYFFYFLLSARRNWVQRQKNKYQLRKIHQILSSSSLPLMPSVIWFTAAHFPYFEKKTKVGLWDHSVCLWILPPYQLLNACTNLYETWAPEPISTAYFIYPCPQHVSLHVYHPIVKQRLGKHVTAAMNTHATTE